MIKKAIQLFQNMGSRYVIFRVGFELKKKFGILKKKFPVNPEIVSFYKLENWKNSSRPFFFTSKEEIKFKFSLSDRLKGDFDNIKDFKYPFFSSLVYDLNSNYDWVTNPDSGHKYNADLHWLDINDYDKLAGDIKFVWEPSRFSHLYTIIRYDHHSGVDCSKQAFLEIERWLDSNKINQGPNFKCSQEISLRVLNWIFALYYYKNSPNLTDKLFDKIQHYIYWQIEHVYHNIDFSRIAVRNNHAITETLTLYIVGLLFPEFPGSAQWKRDGKRWFEEEIAYQIYDDGTFLQFSMNYHRVVIQLLTWALRLSEVNNERFKDIVYERAKKSLYFLLNCMDNNHGWLPNYGANDGALFFKLNDNHYRDYRPQLEALSHALNIGWSYGKFEDTLWYGKSDINENELIQQNAGGTNYRSGGYNIYRTGETFSFIRCGNHKDRPSQADNLHLDVWYKGLNLLHDAGSYKYNAENEDLKYFMGTQSHNTVMLGNNDQMEKGARFIWYNWTQCESVITDESDDYFSFCGTIRAFQHIDKSIRHKRKVKIYKKELKWEIEDHIKNKPKDLRINQIWHTDYFDLLNMTSYLPSGESIDPAISKGYHSIYYGKKEICDEIIFSSLSDVITTYITLK